MRRIALAFLILAHAGLPAAQEDQEQQAATLIYRAAELSNIRTWGVAPFSLRAQVRLLQLAEGEQVGTYTLAWESPNRWRAQINFGDYQDVQVVDEGKQWRRSTMNQEPVRFYQVRQVLDFASRLKLGPQDTANNIRSTPEDESLRRCIEMERFPFSHPVPGVLCFDTAIGNLVREERSHLTNVYSGYRSWRTGLFPRTLRVFEGDTLVVEVRVSELAAIPRADAAWLALPTGAEWIYEYGSGAGGDISPPEKIHHVNPDYYRLPESSRQGEVAIEAVITTEGSVAFARFLTVQPDNALNETVMDAVRQWRYTPAMRDGQPMSVTIVVGLACTTDCGAP